MDIGHWIALGIWAIGQLTALFIGYTNLKVKIKELEMNIESLKNETQNNKSALHIHEIQNEKMFDRFEKKQDETFRLVHEIKDILIQQNRK